VHSTSLPTSWDSNALAAAGYRGFVPLIGVDVNQIEEAHGVYIVMRPQPDLVPTMLTENPVKRRRIRLYSGEALRARWIEGATVVYIGKAAGAAGLRDRLKPFSRMSSSHSGGRAIFQIEDCDELLVCWTVNERAPEAERELIRAFKLAHDGRRPFANWRD
jgi:hypothetical protein